jgi:hypothetical protein
MASILSMESSGVDTAGSNAAAVSLGISQPRSKTPCSITIDETVDQQGLIR